MTAPLDLDALKAQAEAWSRALRAKTILVLSDRVETAEAERDAYRERADAAEARLADAWDEGHQHPWRRGMDECQCGAWSSNECGCGKYGTGELLSLKDNPYREDS